MTPTRTTIMRWVRGGALVLALTFVSGGLYVLAQGLVSVIAAVSDGAHQTLHDHAAIGRVFARTAQRTADASHHLPSWPRVALDYSASVLNLGLAGLLIWLRPRDRAARWLAVAMVGAAGVFNLTAQRVLEHLPLTGLEATAQSLAHVAASLAYGYALLTFPDGRLVPRWSAPKLAAMYLPLAGAAALTAIRVTGTTRSSVVLAFFGLAVATAGVLAQAYRIRTADSATSQAQARLLFWALLPALIVGGTYLWSVGINPTTTALAGRPIADPPVGIYAAFQIVFLAIPLALFVGIIRHRLWDIERVVNRTVVYAVATAFLGGVYAAFVIVVQLSVGTVTTSALIDSKPAVAITTLVLASGFRPIRDRVQAFIDRRFNRARYNAQVTLDLFGVRLRRCDEAEAIAAEMEMVIDAVIAPRTATLWLRP